MAHNDQKALLQITGLVKWFPVKKWFFEKKEYVKNVRDDIKKELQNIAKSYFGFSKETIKAQ